MRLIPCMALAGWLLQGLFGISSAVAAESARLSAASSDTFARGVNFNFHSVNLAAVPLCLANGHGATITDSARLTEYHNFQVGDSS